MENKQTPVFINLLAIARYDQTPEYPIQFMTTGKLYYMNDREALLQYAESQEDEETGDKLILQLLTLETILFLGLGQEFFFLGAGLAVANDAGKEFLVDNHAVH